MRLAAALAVLVVASACPPPRVAYPELDTLTDAQADARVRNAAARRVRMVGTVKAKMPGIQGVVASADLDVALEPVGKVSVAVRSFFEQPMQMLVTDGETVTVFDATQGAPVFLRGRVEPRTIQKVLGIPLSPDEVVEVFLEKPLPERTAKLVGVDDVHGTYDVALDAPGKAPVQATVRASDDAIVRWRQWKKNGEPLLDVTYGDLVKVGDAVMPKAWTITLVDREPHESFVFKATDVDLNGAPLPEDAFHLEPPPNADVRPLLCASATCS